MNATLETKQTFQAVLRGKSVASPSAQTTTLCALGSRPDTSNMDIPVWLEALAKRDHRLKVVLNLLLSTGARVSEMLAVRHCHISSNGHFKICGSKGSRSMFYDSGEERNYMLTCKKNMIDPFAGMNRYYVYREFRKVGLSQKFEGCEKNSVTHLPRHLFAQDIDNVTEDRTDVSAALRHVNEKNVNFYVKK